MIEVLCDKFVGVWDLVFYVEWVVVLVLGYLVYGGW